MIKALGLAIGLLMLVGCGNTAPLSPAPSDDRFGAPSVTAPRDIRQESDPCQAFTPSELAEMGLSSGGRPKTLQTGSRACDWRSGDGGQYLTIILVPDRDVLADTYRTRQFPIFVPFQVAGLPAVSEQSYAGSTTCTVTVGTASGQGFVADSTGSDSSTACRQAERAAQLLVAGLAPLPGK